MDRLIAAFAQLSGKYPEWTLDIFGEGECHESLSQQIHRLQLADRIRLLPPTSHIAEEYENSDFFVLSSDYEGFGLVIIEAMACGLPVVATDCPYGPSDIIDDGKTGLLSQMNVKDLAEKIEWMITHEKERMEMGLRAHEASARYQLERVMPQWLAAYQSVL
jgi:glycosyltransferase involved in cell wall biosynthesis